MSALLLFLTHFPVWVRMAVLIAIFLIILESFLWLIISRMLLYYRLKKILITPEKTFSLFFSRYNKNWILARSFVIEKFAKKYGEKILHDIEIDKLWIERLEKRKYKRDFVRVLNYAFDKGAFKCFLATLKKKRLSPIFLKYLNDSKDMLIYKRLSLSGNGEEFDRKKGYHLYKSKINAVRELTYLPEWKARYFALSLMIHDNINESKTACFEALDDNNSLIRKTIVSEFNFPDKKNAYEKLLNLMLNDPIYDVREASYKRIIKDFSEMYNIDYTKLNDLEAFHLMDFLDKKSSLDHNIALNFLKSKNMELRLNAAVFLQSTGMLDKLLLTLDSKDNEITQRNYTLLSNAFSVNITEFLKIIKKTKNRTVLYASSKLLIEKGDILFINHLAKKVFKIYSNKKIDELYKNSVTSAISRGSDKVFSLLKKELEKNRYNDEKRNFILSGINKDRSIYFYKIIFNFLKDEKIIFNDCLLNTLLNIPEYLLLPELLNIIKNKNKTFTKNIIIRALNVLQKLKLDYSLDFILENLYLYDIGNSSALTENLKNFPKEVVLNKIKRILLTGDAKLNSAIITCFPDAKEKTYFDFIKENFNSTDPDIRISCIKSALRFSSEPSVVENIFNCLYDPVDDVRIEAARIISSFAKKTYLEKLKSIYDKEESVLVKKAIITGLAQSKSTESINILMNKLEADESLENEIIGALSLKTEKKDILEMLGHFKKASFKLKEKIIKVFIKIKDHAANMLVEMLKENNPVQTDFITEILEKTGYVTDLLKKIKHRKPDVRKEVIKLLMILGTRSSYQGIISALKDPLPEIRTMVLKALEKLDSEKSKILFDDLRNDPDKKVRVYAQWAFEKLKAKEIF